MDRTLVAGRNSIARMYFLPSNPPGSQSSEKHLRPTPVIDKVGACAAPVRLAELPTFHEMWALRVNRGIAFGMPFLAQRARVSICASVSRLAPAKSP